MHRTFTMLFAFIVKGANDAAYGMGISAALFNRFANDSQAIVEYLKEYYSLTYIGAALLNNWLHVHFSQQGVAFLRPIDPPHRLHRDLTESTISCVIFIVPLQRWNP